MKNGKPLDLFDSIKNERVLIRFDQKGQQYMLFDKDYIEERKSMLWINYYVVILPDGTEKEIPYNPNVKL